MTEMKQVILPVTGMTCANCVATIERNVKKLDGVQSAAVNLASERATVVFDPARLTGRCQPGTEGDIHCQRDAVFTQTES